MVHSSNVCKFLLASAALFTASCRDGGSVSNAAPRISAVPLQTTPGGSFSLDLDTFVTDREGATLTYSVVSGGGSFAGSSYSNTFASMGEFDVQFSVSDGSKEETGTIKVQVTSANFIAVSEDSSSLLLLETATNSLSRVTSTAPQPYFIANVGTRRFVYRLGVNGNDWVYDPYTGENTQLAAGEAGGARYRGKTSDGKLLYTTGSDPSLELFYYNPETGVARSIADGGLSSLTVAVSSSDIVFFEDGVSGQADVAFYDANDDTVVVIGDEATDEQIQAVLPDGAVVFSRVGSGGETDLFYYRIGTGLVEIGLDNVNLATRNKSYCICGNGTSDTKVVFTALNGANEELFVWNPDNGQTTSISAGVDTEVFNQIGTGNELVYYNKVSATEWDASYYDLDDGVTAVLRDGSDVSRVSDVISDGVTSWAMIRPDGSISDKLAVSLIATPATQTWSAGGPVSSGGVLANGDLVEARADGSKLNVFDVSAGVWLVEIAGTSLLFGGDGLEAGDFVYSEDVTGQDDLKMYDASAASSVVVSDTAGNDAYAAKTLDGTILFTRIVGANTTKDLFSWNGTSETRLTDVDSSGIYHDNIVVGSAFAATRN
jgi:hypothetical protein